MMRKSACEIVSNRCNGHQRKIVGMDASNGERRWTYHAGRAIMRDDGLNGRVEAGTAFCCMVFKMLQLAPSVRIAKDLREALGHSCFLLVMFAGILEG